MILTPTNIIKTLDKYVIGQQEVKEALAIAIRDRWRTLQLPESERNLITNPNVVLRGPSGSGKTLSLQVLARELGLPIYITPVTRFTQSGYKGDDLDSVISEFVEANASKRLPKWYTEYLEKNQAEKTAKKPTTPATTTPKKEEPKEEEEEGVLGKRAKPDQSYKNWSEEELEKHFKGLKALPRRSITNFLIEARSLLGLRKSPANIRKEPWESFAKVIDKEIPLASYFDWKTSRKWRGNSDWSTITISPRDVYGAGIECGESGVKLTGEYLIDFVCADLNVTMTPNASNGGFGLGFGAGDNLLQQKLDELGLGGGKSKPKKTDKDKLQFLEQFGIIFLDEFDKLADTKGDNVGGFGVQRELLTMVEGREMSTPLGTINTRNLLFVSAGAYQAIDESGIMVELKGRFPIVAELSELNATDLEGILKHTRNNRLIQERLKLKTENVSLEFSDDLPSLISDLAIKLNKEDVSIGARRLDNIVAKLLRYVSVNADKYHGKVFNVDKAYFEKQMKGEIDKVNELKEKRELREKLVKEKLKDKK